MKRKIIEKLYYFLGRRLPINKILSERIFDRIHQTIEKANNCKQQEASKIALELCHFFADELNKKKT